MNEKELREKFTPKKVSSQLEFDSFMRQLNERQSEDNVPTNSRKAEINVTRAAIKQQMSILRERLSQLRMEYITLEQRQKAYNRACHQLKHEMIVLNPISSDK